MMGNEPGSGASPMGQGGAAEQFYRALGQALDEHPNELAVIKNHLRKQVEGRARPSRPDPDNPTALIEGAEKYHELLVSMLESKPCRNALKVLEDAHQRKLAEAGGSDKARLVAVFVGLGIGVGFCILEGLYGDPGGICF